MAGHMLPFPKGKEVWASQVNNDPNPSHGPGTKMAWAFDFNLGVGNEDEGEVIVAAAGGTMVKVRESTSDDTCGGSEFSGRANYILIRHDEGGCDLYLHLMQNSVSRFGLQVGSRVVRGQEIGLLGKTGWTGCGAHLHFQHQRCGLTCQYPCPAINYFQQSVEVTFDDVPEPDHKPRKRVVYVSQNEREVPPPPPSSLVEALWTTTCRPSGATYTPEHPLLAYAIAHRLGAPLGLPLNQTLNQQPYVIQVFARDTLYAPQENPTAVGRMSDLLRAQDPLGTALLQATFSAMGSAFHPYWATHLYYLEQMETRPLGAPLGPVRTLEFDGKRYDLEFFALDTLYTLVPNWRDVRRLSDLLRPIAPPPGQEYDWALGGALHQMMRALLSPQHTLERWLVEQTYQRAGIAFDPDKARFWYALGQVASSRPLGNPLGGGPYNGEYAIEAEGIGYGVEVYAGDTIFWAPPNWRDIRRLSDLGA